MHSTRRDFLRIGLGGAATLILPGAGFPAAANAEAMREDPHFFLMIVLKGGADTSYMFDARPLAMTAAGRIQNYLGEDPEPWTGFNGVSAAATSLVKPLAPYSHCFSVLNGVVMTPSFDGHEQNMNFLFTGDPFGGSSFIPHLNLPGPGRVSHAVDAIVPAESTEADTANHSGVIPLEPRILKGLPDQLRELPPAHAENPVNVFARARLEAIAQGDGIVSAGARRIRKALDASPEVHRKLEALSPADPGQSREEQSIALIADCFRLSMSRSAIYVLPEQFDVHAPDLAKTQPELFSSAIGKIAALLKGLLETPYDGKRSMFEVTTVMVASEFGRTMRAPGQPVDATGTDHNQYSNSLLLGGKGVKPGLVVGASDLADVDAPVSNAHLSIDPALEKTFGKPFDFKTMRPRDDMPDSFQITDYLTIGSAINTVYSLFDVPLEYHRETGRDLGRAPVLRRLLS